MDGNEERRNARSAAKSKLTKAISSPEMDMGSNLQLKKLLFNEASHEGSVAAPAYSDPTGGGRKRDPKRTVLTPQGRHVLTSDARLHLERIKALKQHEEQMKAHEEVSLEDDLQALDTKRRLLATKVRQQREIARLEAEIGNASQEYQTRDDDEVSWMPSANSEYSTKADIAGSYSSRRRKKKSTYDEEEEEEKAGSKLNTELAKIKRELAQLRDHIKRAQGVWRFHLKPSL